jgi:glycosyltransferase involved in cell wall biosynthesis
MMPVWWAIEFIHLLAQKTDCIHACDFDTLVPALAVKLIKRTKVVYDIYDIYSAKSNTLPTCLKSTFRVAERMLARLADGVVMPDPARVSFFGDKPPKQLAIAMNCPHDIVDPSWTKNDGEQFVIFYGGLIARYRGIRKLVRITAGINNVKLLIAGWITDDSYKTLIDESEHVEFLGLIGYVEALRRTYYADAVYSYYDPVLEINRTANSSKMFDAFMCSTPVLANSEPPAAHIVEKFDSGSLLKYDNEEQLANTIEEWRDNREIAHAKGRNGRKLFDGEFNAERQGRNILDLYSRIGF